MKNIPHLHCHDYYSLLDGVPSPEAYLKTADELDIPAIAFTNHGNMASHCQASIEGSKYKAKTILGLEAYVVPSVKKMNLLRSKSDEKSKAKLKLNYRSSCHAVLLAKNEDGYRNLISINNDSWQDGFYYRNRTCYYTLRDRSDGLICLSACMSGVLSKPLLVKNYRLAEKRANFLKNAFGKDFFIELQFLGIPEQEIVNRRLVVLGTKLNIPFVITNDTHYLRKGDHKIQMLLMELATKGGFVYESKGNYLRTIADFEEAYNNQTAVPKKTFHQALDNAFEIADRCRFVLKTGNLYFPKFDHKTHFLFKKFPIENKDQFFKKIVLHRAKKILESNMHSLVYKKRLAYEYKTLVNLGAVDYFLIVDDLLHYIRQQGAFSVIRGSANGSLIAFILEFGLIDPIEHGILFERFISKYRSLNDVDIDLDVRSEFRQKAIEYLKKKYGTDRVIPVGSYNRMLLKGAVKDITRVFKEKLDDRIHKTSSEKKASKLAERQEQYTFATINSITSAIIGEPTVAEARKNYKMFDTWYGKNKKIMKRYIEPVIGNVRNVSMHPAGVIITPGSVDEILPIRTQVNPHNKKERIVATVWENSHTGREDLNEIGVMALDILAVKTLSIVSEILTLVEKRTGEKIDLRKLDLTDKKTYKMLNEVELIGVFQLSGGATTQVVNITKITEFNDLIAIVALSRPGSLGAKAEVAYAERKVNPSLVKYDHHSLKKVLGDSLGVLVFSEHILRTASEFAGMHPKEADALRKIIKGKNLKAFASYKKMFINGAMQKWKKEPDIKEVADKIWKKFSKAGSYLFPRGHAASYALLAFICQYLKVHYPIEFFACHLQYVPQEKYDDIRMVAENVYKIKFKWPNINNPCNIFKPYKNGIRWPVTGLKNVGDKAASSIVENAPYSSFEDFFDKVDKRVCNKRVVENLIIAGAFRDFGNKRAVIARYVDLREKAGAKNVTVPPAFDSKEALSIAMADIYGFELVSLKKLYYKKLKLFKKIMSLEEFKESLSKERVVVFGRVDKFNQILTKKNDQMAFVSLKDGKSVFDITLFPDAFKFARKYFKIGNVLVVSGRKNIWGKSHSLVLEVDTDDPHVTSFKKGSWVREL